MREGRPQPVDPGVGRDAAGVQPVDALGPDGGVGDEAGVLQHAQVLRDGRPTHGQACGELADRLRPLRDQLQDAATRRVAEGVEDRSVSRHER